MPFFVIFLMLPLIEIAVFIAVGDKIGILTTLLFALGTAMLGGSIIRQQGLQVMSDARQSMDGGHIPAQEIFTGFCLVAAGATLITPGFVTDAIGFLLLVPPVRIWLKNFLIKHFNLEMGAHQNMRQSDPNVIEGDYVEIKKDDP